jgi:putative DNA primase/helicase
LKTYGEKSISGTGVHYLFLNQRIPEGFKNRTNKTASFDMEVYESGRYFTVSGERINSYCLGKDKEGLDTLLDIYMPRRVSTLSVRREKNVKGSVLETALEKDNRFCAVYNGKRPNGNESSDDMSLVNYLVKYIGRDVDRVKKEFLLSPHFKTKDEYHSSKCTDRSDYLERTIETAITGYFTGYSLDDVGNSAMFTDNFSNTLCFVPEWNCWCYYNGKKWEKRAEFHAQECAKELSETFALKVDEYEASNGDKDVLKAMKEHCKKLRGYRQIDSLIKLSKSSMLKSADEFDASPFLFNCKNGVYDMSTGEFRNHTYTDYSTNISDVEYKPGEPCKKWDAFLDKILPKDIQEFLQMSVGMAAVGRVYEEAMIFMIGGGSNGKSTIANILSAVFGDYSITLQPDIITATRDGKTPPDFAEVRGKRLVFLSETEEGDRLSVKALKRLSSNEKQSARRLYSMPETFEPSHTVFYSTNHKPRIGSNDNGTWRRIKNIPFEYQISVDEKITDFAEQVIKEESSGVLEWCMEGARMFIENGMKLKTPDIIVKATEEYKENEDYLGMFIKDKCYVGILTTEEGGVNRIRCGASELYRAYKDYCQENNYYYKNVSDFNNQMEQVQGVKKINSKGVKTWVGIRIEIETQSSFANKEYNHVF